MVKSSESKYLRKIVLHLLDIVGGKCSITDDVVHSETNEDFKSVLAGLMLIHEDHQYSLTEIINSTQEEESRTNSLLDSITSLAMLDYSSKACVSKKGNAFDAVAIGINMLGEELQASTYSSAYLNSIFQAAPGLLIVTDMDGLIRKINVAFEERLGYDHGELFDQDISSLCREYADVDTKSNMCKIRAMHNREVIFQARSGGKISILLSVTHIGKVGGSNNEGWVLAGLDISELKEVQGRLQSTNERLQDTLDNVNQIIYSETMAENREYHLDFVSKSVENILGYTVEEFMSKSKQESSPKYHPDDVAHINERLEHLRTSHESVVITYRSLHNKTGKYVWLEDRVVPKFKADGQLKGVLGSTSDITERKKAEEIAERFGLVMDVAGDSFYLIDPCDRDKIVDVNASASKELGYTREELLKMRISELEIELPYSRRQKRNRLIHKNSKRNKSTLFQGVHLRRDKSTFPVEISVIDRKIGGKLYQLAAVRDITDRIKAEHELAEREAKYRAITESAQDAIISIDAGGRIIMWNKSAKRMFGYREQEMIGQKLSKIIPEKYRKHHNKGVSQYARTGKSSMIGKSLELEGLKKNGSVIPLELTLSEWKIGDEKFVTGIIKDITDRKRAINELWQSEQRYRRFIDQSQEMIYSFNMADGKLIEANPTFLRTLGYSVAEAWNMTIYNLVADSRKAIDAFIRKLRKKGGLSLGERDWQCKNGELVSVLVSISLVKEGKTEMAYVIARNVTQNKKDRLLIEQSLEEKELLLKEVHHRVKNNLQVISSLLDLQASSVDDIDLIEKLKESQNRVKSMALVHEKLYATEELNGIDLGEYARELTRSIHTSYQKEAGVVELRLKMNSVKVPITKAIPCGLIINEAVSNSMKHAFPGSNSGIIKVEIIVKENDIQLGISDNGIGFDSKIDIKKPSTLGLKLISVLSKQLDATLDVDSAKGVKYKIRFNFDNKGI